jgi:pyridoxal 5'-phosphate synthase pdxS subunit
MIRSKGEAGTGNIVEAVRHLRSILGDIRKITQADSAELFDWAKRCRRRCRSCRRSPRPVAAGAAVLRRRHRHPGRRRARDAARRRGGVRRLGHLQERRPAPRAKAIVEATTHFRDPHILAKVSRGLGAPMTGIGMDEINQRYAERGW